MDGLSELERTRHAEAHFDSLFAGFCGLELPLVWLELGPDPTVCGFYGWISGARMNQGAQKPFGLVI